MVKTLFLDRDGVINQRVPGNYIRRTEDFIFLKNVPEAIAQLSNIFDKIFVVTNQAGVGKSLMNETQLAGIHLFMEMKIRETGGRIDGIYFCPHRPDENCNCRKPAPGMAFQAKKDFPEIDFSNAWMVGDSAADILFGKNSGMKTAQIFGKMEEEKILSEMAIDWRGESLWDFFEKNFN